MTDAFANLIYYSRKGGGNKASLILLFFLAVPALLAWLRYYLYKSPYKRLEVFGQAIHQALLLFGHIQTQETRIQVVRDRKDAINTLIYLKGGTMREKELFSQTMIEFFAPIENQRYILKAQERCPIRQNISPCQASLTNVKKMPKPLWSKSERAWVSMTSSIPEAPKAVLFF